MTSLSVSTRLRQGPGLLLFRLSDFSDKLTQLLKVNPSLLKSVRALPLHELG